MSLEEAIMETVRTLPESDQQKVLGFAEALNTRPRFRTGRYWDGEKEMEWVARNREAYMNMWVSLDGDRLVAAYAEDAIKVYEAARAQGVEISFVKHIVPEESHTSGWIERVD